MQHPHQHGTAEKRRQPPPSKAACYNAVPPPASLYANGDAIFSPRGDLMVSQSHQRRRSKYPPLECNVDSDGASSSCQSGVVEDITPTRNISRSNCYASGASVHNPRLNVMLSPAVCSRDTEKLDSNSALGKVLRSGTRSSNDLPLASKSKWRQATKPNVPLGNESFTHEKGALPNTNNAKNSPKGVARSIKKCAASHKEGINHSPYAEYRSSWDDEDSTTSWHHQASLESCRISCQPQPCRSGFCFQPHWPSTRVEQALKMGEAFQAKIRMNAHNRNEAYVSLDGITVDLLIDGSRAQNRAIDGDIVAVVVNPQSDWCRLRGSFSKQKSDDFRCNSTDVYPENSEYMLDHKALESSSESQVDNIVRESSGESMLDNRSPESSSDEETLCILERPRKEVEEKSSAENCSHLYSVSQLDVTSNCLRNGQDYQQSHDMLEAQVKDSLLFGPKKALDELASLVAYSPGMRPTGMVVAILQKSTRRKAVIGFLEVSQNAGNRCRQQTQKKVYNNKCGQESQRKTYCNVMMLIPCDNKLPKMAVYIDNLPADLRRRLQDGDTTVGSELIAGCVLDWAEDSIDPVAEVRKSFGQGGEIGAQTAAILFEHAIHSAEFPPAALECLPKIPWKIPDEEWNVRRNLTKCRAFTIDPATSRDLDDALSIEKLENGLVKVGLHIADVSYFVRPDTVLDIEAQMRSNSVYLVERVLPMLPRLLCEELCSLNPGVNRLAFSIMWVFDDSGQTIDRWIGRSIICSCTKLSYQHVQSILDGKFEAVCGGSSACEHGLPNLHGDFEWPDIIQDIKCLHEIAKQMREKRFEAGALVLDNTKLVFELDEDGIPNDSSFCELQDSNFLVEEMMLLANMTAAEVISCAFPECALLRRHPEPNLRKLRELEEFCHKNGLELDTSSSRALQESLTRLRESHKDDRALCSILTLYATKPMQLASYFSSGEVKYEDDWAHYALATPLYTHFTSPIRRYPDIIVHRTLLAALDAEDILAVWKASVTDEVKADGTILVKEVNLSYSKGFTGLTRDQEKVESPSRQRALATAASNHKVLESRRLAIVADHCNERKLASRNVKEASDKLYLWAMLRKRKGVLSEARVLAVGPKFVSLYVHKIAMERRVHYEETGGLCIEWFNMTSTLVLDLMSRKTPVKKQGLGHTRCLADVALLLNPAFHDFDKVFRLEGEEKLDDEGNELDPGHFEVKQLEPAVLPLTLRLLSTVPVYVFAIGGDGGPLDIAVRLYLSSYLT